MVDSKLWGQGMIAQMAERAAQNPEFPSSSLRSGSYENQTKVKPYCQLQHVAINNYILFRLANSPRQLTSRPNRQGKQCYFRTCLKLGINDPRLDSPLMFELRPRPAEVWSRGAILIEDCIKYLVLRMHFQFNCSSFLIKKVQVMFNALCLIERY